MTVQDDLVIVFLVACRAERTKKEDNALRRIGVRLDKQRNARTVTNPRFDYARNRFPADESHLVENVQ